MCSHAAATRSFKFMIFITFKSHDKTCPKIEQKWFLLVHRVEKNSKMNKTIEKRPEVFCKKGIFKNFAKFTGKHLCWRLFKKELQVLSLYQSIGTIFSHTKGLFCYFIFIRKYQNTKRQFLQNRNHHWRCSIKKVFLKISQNLKKNTCVKVSFLINFIKNFLRQVNQVFAYHNHIFCYHFFLSL